ncbi:MAG: hypothetical protein J6A37_14385 [Oscillospiraceae bacterium]|nr:hypothetical protein [Oscillospiraceae bacterium]
MKNALLTDDEFEMLAIYRALLPRYQGMLCVEAERLVKKQLLASFEKQCSCVGQAERLENDREA